MLLQINVLSDMGNIWRISHLLWAVILHSADVITFEYNTDYGNGTLIDLLSVAMKWL